MAKKMPQVAINWKALAERVPPHQKHSFLAFKAKSDAYFRRVLKFPEDPPPIDWEFYQKIVPVEGMVANFKQQYEALKVPYPADDVTSTIGDLEVIIRKDIEGFKKVSDLSIADFRKKLDHLASLIPFDQMTMEDYKDAYPEDAIDPINKPTFWPHTPSNQHDYVEKETIEE